jgi:hypothetical protein
VCAQRRATHAAAARRRCSRRAAARISRKHAKANNLSLDLTRKQRAALAAARTRTQRPTPRSAGAERRALGVSPLQVLPACTTQVRQRALPSHLRNATPPSRARIGSAGRVLRGHCCRARARASRMLSSCGAAARAAVAPPRAALAARAAAAAASRAAPSCRRAAHRGAPQAAARRTPTRAALPSLGAALRRAASAAAAAMAAATGAASGAAAPWRDPTHFTKDRWWTENTVAVVRLTPGLSATVPLRTLTTAS